MQLADVFRSVINVETLSIKTCLCGLLVLFTIVFFLPPVSMDTRLGHFFESVFPLFLQNVAPSCISLLVSRLFSV